jgi:hypothetical protein
MRDEDVDAAVPASLQLAYAAALIVLFFGAVAIVAAIVL